MRQTLTDYYIRFGTAFSFISQIALTACVWLSCTQWLWFTVERKSISVQGLNRSFGADTSIFDLFSWEMIRKNKLGFAMGLFAWYELHLIHQYSSSFSLFLSPPLPVSSSSVALVEVSKR